MKEAEELLRVAKELFAGIDTSDLGSVIIETEDGLILSFEQGQKVLVGRVPRGFSPVSISQVKPGDTISVRGDNPGQYVVKSKSVRRPSKSELAVIDKAILDALRGVVLVTAVDVAKKAGLRYRGFPDDAVAKSRLHAMAKKGLVIVTVDEKLDSVRVINRSRTLPVKRKKALYSLPSELERRGYTID